ncbi:MAG: selenide, water dikinase SelD [Victivallales bacterium]|nr:selenide, water dikinase SelD [Victivallales bacterium]
MKKKVQNKLKVEEGGCSVKFSGRELKEIMRSLSSVGKAELLVGKDSFDDAVVWKTDKNNAIIQTVDFFPPLCEEPYFFGQIAAANAVSDIYAMGGTPLFALNIVMFPAEKNIRGLLSDILRGGNDKLNEAGIVLAGGHTIKDEAPKYGLTVTGNCHPEKIFTNSNAVPGEKLILTKALGTGIVLAGKKIGELSEKHYLNAIKSMSQLNNITQILRKHDVKCATDVTGFGLAGHCVEIADGSRVNVKINTDLLPLLKGVNKLLELGCMPCALFNNLESYEEKILFDENVDYSLKMLCSDAQTSGGILFTCKAEKAEFAVEDLHKIGFESSAVIGEIQTITGNKKIIIE